jgi:hypothetical protein
MINADEQSPKKPFKLIAVDDNQVNLTVMVKQLGRDTGYHITTFENGS